MSFFKKCHPWWGGGGGVWGREEAGKNWNVPHAQATVET